MFTKRLSSLSLLGVLSFALLTLTGYNPGLLAGVVTVTPTPGALFTSPLPTPPTEPTPPPVPTPSPQARIALQHIADREGIPLANLLIANEHPCGFPLLGRQFVALTIFDQVGHRSFKLLVDLKDGNVVDDVAAMEQAEAEASRANYGKLQPALYERLQTVDDKEELPVAIWVGGKYGRTTEELYAALASRYPEVRDALARHSSPFDVRDSALSHRIQNEYEQMSQEDIITRIQPLVTHVKSRGGAVKTHFLLPSVTTTLPKADILELAKREDVQTIYLIEGKEKPALDTGVPTNRVAPVWSALGIADIPEPTIPITIAILEAGNVDRNNSYLHHASIWRDSPSGKGDHTTRVASDAASFHGTYRGMAPGATILSAGENGTIPDVHTALTWALDHTANLVNYSAGFDNNTSELEWLAG